MSFILVYPKLDCGVGCWYCFGKKTCSVSTKPYDRNKMMETFKGLVDAERRNTKHSPKACLHGGEVCSLPLDDFEFFLRTIYEYGITPSIQTSMMGMTQEHIRLFKAYKVHVGISIDGPPEFNILRGPRNPEKNKEYQDEILRNIDMMEKNGIQFGFISILSKVNASPDKIDTLIGWAKRFEHGGRFNAMWIPNGNPNSSLKQFELTNEELKNAWIKTADAVLMDKNLNINPIRDQINNLMGYSLSSCSAVRCDYITTTCRTIFPDGNVGKCDRTLQDDISYIAPKRTYVRSEMLKQTDCFGCKYFQICGGGCPAETSDFRDKTKFCEATYATLEYLETRLRGMLPNVFLSIDDPTFFEEYYLKNKPFDWMRNMKRGTWQRGEKPNSCQQKNDPRPFCGHGDHMDQIPPKE